MGSQLLTCRIGAGLSRVESASEAAEEAAREARGGALGRAEVDLAFIFLSPGHLVEAEAAAEAVREELAPRHLLGCVAEGVVAGVRGTRSRQRGRTPACASAAQAGGHSRSSLPVRW